MNTTITGQQLVTFSDDPILFLQQNPVMFAVVLFGIVLLIMAMTLWDQRKYTRSQQERIDRLSKVTDRLRTKLIETQQKSMTERSLKSEEIDKLNSKISDLDSDLDRAREKNIDLHKQLNNNTTQMIQMRKMADRHSDEKKSVDGINSKLMREYRDLHESKTSLEVELREVKLSIINGTFDVLAIKAELGVQ